MNEQDTDLQELQMRADAFQTAAEAATLLAVRNGASDVQVADRLAELHHALARHGRTIEPQAAVARAQYTLLCRREICRAMARLAIESGVSPDELERTMSAMMNASAQLSAARTLTDLGFEAAA